jgi:NADH dehydrogenase
MKAGFLQGWAEKLDLVGRKITIEEAADDPRQSLAPTGQTQKEERAASRDSVGGKYFDLTYDKLVIAVGCYSQTFNTPGVKENAYFLKDVGDARKIRQRLLDCFEIAALPTTTDEMRSYLLNFAVVGGGRKCMNAVSKAMLISCSDGHRILCGAPRSGHGGHGKALPRSHQVLQGHSL